MAAEDDKQATAAPASVDGKPVLQLKIYSPYKTYFDDSAFSISGVNTTGPFDILPQHHNFLSLVNACELVIQAPVGQKIIKISGGLMYVQSDEVRVFLDV